MITLKREIKELLWQRLVDRMTKKIETECAWRLSEASAKAKTAESRRAFLVLVIQKHFKTFGNLDKETFEKLIKEMEKQ